MILQDIVSNKINFADALLLLPPELENAYPFTGGINIFCVQQINPNMYRPINALPIHPNQNKGEIISCLMLDASDEKIMKMKLDALKKSEIRQSHIVLLYDYFFQKQLSAFQTMVLEAFDLKPDVAKNLDFYTRFKSEIMAITGEIPGLSELKLLVYAHHKGLLNTLHQLSALTVFSTGKLRNTISMLEGLKRTGMHLPDIYPELAGLCGQNANQSPVNYPIIKNYLEKKLNPTITKFTTAFDTLANELRNECGQKIQLSPDFEAGSIDLKVKLNKSKQFGELSDSLKLWENSGQAEKLFRILDGEL